VGGIQESQGQKGAAGWIGSPSDSSLISEEHLYRHLEPYVVGTYFSPPVMAVDIPKKGAKRGRFACPLSGSGWRKTCGPMGW